MIEEQQYLDYQRYNFQLKTASLIKKKFFKKKEDWNSFESR